MNVNVPCFLVTVGCINTTVTPGPLPRLLVPGPMRLFVTKPSPGRPGSGPRAGPGPVTRSTRISSSTPELGSESSDRIPWRSTEEAP
eukprot:1038392-Rhodomonas_salina.3